MKVTVIGSADAFNSSGYGHSCYLIQSEGAGNLMIDFGPTALLGLRRAGIEPVSLDGIAFTHLHGDHIGGYPFLVIDALYNGVRERAFPLLGPVLTQSTLQTLLDATYAEVQESWAKVGGTIQELVPGDRSTFLGYRIEAFAAAHMKPPHRPLCLRVTDPAGTTAAFSGDTKLCPGLLDAARGVDLLIAECTRLAQPAGQHCTWAEWIEVLPTLDAKAVVFSHLGGDVREQLPRLRTEIQGKPVQFAEDGMLLTVCT